MRMTDTTARLLAAGWRRDEGPADLLPECGADTEISICGRRARWNKLGVHLCATHALRAERASERW